MEIYTFEVWISLHWSINTDTNTGIDIIDIWVDTPTATVDLQKFQYISSLWNTIWHQQPDLHIFEV